MSRTCFGEMSQSCGDWDCSDMEKGSLAKLILRSFVNGLKISAPFWRRSMAKGK